MRSHRHKKRCYKSIYFSYAEVYDLWQVMQLKTFPTLSLLFCKLLVLQKIQVKRFSCPKVSSLKFLCESGSCTECEQVNAESDNVLIILYVIFVSLVGSQSRKTFRSCHLHLSLQKGLWGWKESSRRPWYCIMCTNPDHKKGVLTVLYCSFLILLA